KPVREAIHIEEQFRHIQRIRHHLMEDRRPLQLSALINSRKSPLNQIHPRKRTRNRSDLPAGRLTRRILNGADRMVAISLRYLPVFNVIVAVMKSKYF